MTTRRSPENVQKWFEVKNVCFITIEGKGEDMKLYPFIVSSHVYKYAL